MDSQRRFGQPHVEMFVCLGLNGWTPRGPRISIHILAARVASLLDLARQAPCVRFLARDVITLAQENPACEAHSA